MKRTAAFVIAAALLVPGAAFAAQKKKATKQEVSGTILTRGTSPNGPDTDCFPGWQRRIAIITSEQVNGVAGYHFTVDPGTVGKPFVLEATGGVGTVDLDIQYVSKFGPPTDPVTDPTQAGAPATFDFNEREPGGEHGKVPQGFEKAIVCMFDGVNSSFTYTAGKGVKLPK